MSSFGFNFRTTSGFVSDPAGSTYSLGETTPQTRNGITFQWSVAPAGARDRSTTVDHRVSGINFASAAAPGTFVVTLPAAGVYNIGCAMGDATNSQSTQYIQIFDNTTSLWSMQSASTPAANQYYDINGNLWTSDTAWAAGQTFKTLTLATTTLKVVIGKNGVGANHTLAHLDVNAVPRGLFRPPDLSLGAGGSFFNNPLT